MPVSPAVIIDEDKANRKSELVKVKTVVEAGMPFGMDSRHKEIERS